MTHKSVFKRSLETVILLSGLFLVTLSGLFLSAEVASAQATDPMFAQVVKKEIVSPYANSHDIYVSCNLLTESIENVVFSITTPLNTTTSYEGYRLRVYSDSASSSISARTSDSPTIFARGAQRDVNFQFSSPLDVDGELCSSGGDVLFNLSHPVLNTTSFRTYVVGTNTGTNSQLSYGSSTSKDPYIIINGIAEVNHLPVVDPVETQFAEEGGFFSLQLTGSDKDQIEQLYFIGENLPEGAIVVNDYLYWTPRYDQFGTYENIRVIGYDRGNGQIPFATSSQEFAISVADRPENFPLIKQIQKDSEVLSIPFFQDREIIFSCDELTGSIETLDLSVRMIGGNTTQPTSLLARFYKGDEPGYRTSLRRSDSITSPIVGKLNQGEVRFTFPSPIDVQGDLCNGIDEVVLRVDVGSSAVVLYGASTNVSNVVRIAGVDGDPYFIINASSTPISNTATTTLEAVHDTYSTTFAPGTQKGSENWIRVQDVSKVSHQYKHMHRGFAHVDTTSIPVNATVATATMRLYVSEAAKPGSVMVQLPTTTWNESTLTVNNVPDVDFAPVALIEIKTTDVGTYVEFDVTDLVANWVSGSITNNGLMLSPLGAAVEFGTKESGQPIKISVTYDTN